MDETENKSISQPNPDSSDLREQLDSLRRLVGSILFLLVWVSGTLTIFMLREMSNVSKELDSFRPGATNMITFYQRQQGPAIDEFIKRLQQYGQAHKDFDPILLKYSLKPGAQTGAPPAAAVPPPLATPSKK